MSKLQLIAGRSHPELAKKIAKILDFKLAPTEIKDFANGEIYVRIKQKVRGDDVFLIQNVAPPVNKNLVELLITIDALKRASAGRINVVCPHFGYCRQDRKKTSREPISAKLVANLISKAGADRVLSIDLHTDQIQGFFDIPVDHFVGYPQFVDYLKRGKYSDLVVVSPDVGGVKRGREMATLMEVPLVIIDKRRRVHNKAEVLHVIGKVEEKTAVIIDDMIDTAGTVNPSARALKESGAKNIIICATHGLLSGNATEKLTNCPASKVLLLDTIPVPKEKMIDKIEVLSLAPLLARVIERIHEGRSLGALFTWEEKVRE